MKYSRPVKVISDCAARAASVQCWIERLSHNDILVKSSGQCVQFYIKYLYKS